MEIQVKKTAFREHRRTISNNIEISTSLKPVGRHRRTLSNTAFDFKRIFSGCNSPEPEKIIVLQEEKEAMTPDSLTIISESCVEVTQERHEESSRKPGQFLKLLDAAVVYFNTDNGLLAESVESFKEKCEKMRLKIKEIEKENSNSIEEYSKIRESLHKQKKLTEKMKNEEKEAKIQVEKLEKSLAAAIECLKLKKVKTRKVEENWKPVHCEFQGHKKPIIIKQIGKTSPTGSFEEEKSHFSLGDQSKHARSDSTRVRR